MYSLIKLWHFRRCTDEGIPFERQQYDRETERRPLTFVKAPLSLINLMSQLNRSFRAVSWYVRSWFGRTISASEGISWSINTRQPVRDAR